MCAVGRRPFPSILLAQALLMKRGMRQGHGMRQLPEVVRWALMLGGGFSMGCGHVDPGPAGNGGMAGTRGLGDAGASSEASAGNAGAPGGEQCMTDDGMGPSIYTTFVGATVPLGRYDGPAVVERSTEDDLILDFEVPSGMRHLQIGTLSSSSLPLLVLPASAQVWLSASFTDASAGTQSAPFWYPRSWSVRDREGGVLLLGATNDLADPAGPIEVREPVDGCVEPHPACRQIIHQSVELMGDNAEVVGDGQSATVTVAGREYLAHVSAQRWTIRKDFPCSQYEYRLGDGSSFVAALQLKDPKALVDELAIGDVSACAYGNDRSASAYFYYPMGQGPPDHYAGPVVYKGRDAELYPGAYLFEVPGQAEGTPMLDLLTKPGIFQEPQVGTEFWFDDAGGPTLRGAGGGAVILASQRLTAPFGAATSSWLEQTLGVAVHAEKRCDYSDIDGQPLGLWDLIVDTEPPVRVTSGNRTPLNLGGRAYEAWAWSPTDIGTNGLDFVLYAAP